MLGSSPVGWIKWALMASAVCAYLACQKEETRPAGAGDCEDECTGAPSPIRNPVGSVAGLGGSAGASGNGNGTGGSSGSAGSSSMGDTLSGSIEALSANLSADPNLNGTVKVQAAGLDVDQVSVTSEPSGDFRLVGVHGTLPLWVGVGPFSGDPASSFVDTLQVVDSPLTLPVQLLVMRRTALQDIAASFLVNDTGLDATRGHVILHFIDDKSVGIAGATLVSPNPLTTSVAYDAGDTYSDQAMETDLRGTMVLLNLPSSPYPGSASTIAVRALGAQRNLDVRIATGALTLVTAVIPR